MSCVDGHKTTKAPSTGNIGHTYVLHYRGLPTTKNKSYFVHRDRSAYHEVESDDKHTKKHGPSAIAACGTQ